MATAKKAQPQHQDPEVVIEAAIDRTESFIERNARTLYTAVGIIAVIVCGYFAWKYLIAQPRSEKAADLMFVAEQQFAAESWQAALDGDGQNAGFLEVIDTYGGTPEGNLARQYAGICYLKLGQPDEALEQLAKYNTRKGAPAQIINAQNFGLRGDIFTQKADYQQALAMYRKAIDAADNAFTTPYYLKKAGLASEQLGDNATALAYYQRIADEFGMSMEARDIEKSIGALKQK